MNWQEISTAPTDRKVIYVKREIDGKRLYAGLAVWRTVHFPAFLNGTHDVPGETATGWMYPNIDKRFPEPTHWDADSLAS